MEHVHMNWLGLRNYRLRFGDSRKLPFTNEPAEYEDFGKITYRI